MLLLKLGVIVFLYFVWYGLVCIVMELLRDYR